MKDKLLIYCIVISFFFSCNSTRKVVEENKQDTFKNFQFLDIPVSDLRIGAIYIDNIGANSNGLIPEKLVVQNSYSKSSLSSSKSSQAKIDASLFALLGINANFAKSDKISINYSGIELVTVKDIFEIPIQASSKYIFQGLRVKNLSIISDKELTSQIRANLKENLESVEIDVTPMSSKDNITLSGSDIYIAQKLINFGKPSVQSFESEVLDHPKYSKNGMEGPKIFGEGAVINDYEITINTEDILQCLKNSEVNNESKICTMDMSEIFKNSKIYFLSVDNNKDKAYRLQRENCINLSYSISIHNSKYLTNAGDVKLEIPFLMTRQSNNYIIGSQLLNDSYVIDKINFTDLRFQHEQYFSEDIKSCSPYNFEGTITLTSYIYPISISK